MLYVTTRNDRDAFTPYRVLREDRGQDGGVYVPFRLPQMSGEEIAAFAEKRFNSRIADGLNLLFRTRLTSWDIDLAIGKESVRLQRLGQKIILEECWHNPDRSFSGTVRALSGLLCGSAEDRESCADWVFVASHIAVLCGVFGELLRTGMAGDGKTVDIAVAAGDFSALLGAWYARAMGLPVGTIVCCCGSNSAIWELFHYGQLRTESFAGEPGRTEEHAGLERLLYGAGGCPEVKRYLEACRSGGVYQPEERTLRKLREGMYITVSSPARIAATEANLYKSEQLLLSYHAALAYSGLQDFRAGTGMRENALILSEQSPLLDGQWICKVLDIPEQEIKRYL